MREVGGDHLLPQPQLEHHELRRTRLSHHSPHFSKLWPDPAIILVVSTQLRNRQVYVGVQTQRKRGRTLFLGGAQYTRQLAQTFGAVRRRDGRVQCEYRASEVESCHERVGGR